MCNLYVPVAQWIERLPSKQKVVSSTLTRDASLQNPAKTKRPLTIKIGGLYPTQTRRGYFAPIRSSRAILLDRVHHYFNIFRFGFLYEVSISSQDITATFAADLNELFTIFVYF